MKLASRLKIILGFTVILTVSSPSFAAESIFPGPVTQPKMTPALNLGKMLYDAKCASCHGINTAGTKKGPTFLNRVYHPGHHGDAAFFHAPKNGAKAHHWPFGDMPPVEGITDSQTQKIVPYIRAVQHANGIF